jgi:outer membrane protein assembly factor BamB
VEDVRSAHVVADHSALGFMAAQARPRRLWVGGVDALSWIDPRDESVYRVDSKPGVSLFVDHGSLYRAAYLGGDVARYDVPGPNPREVARVRAPSPIYLSVDHNKVWVADHDRGRLVWLDPGTLARRGTLHLGPPSGDTHALAGMAPSRGDRLWVVSERDKRVYEIDTRTGREVGHVQLDARPTDEMVRDGHYLWVMLSRSENDEGADLELVDAARRRVVTRIVAHDPAFVTPENKDLLASPPVVVHGEVWVPSDEHLVHLDAADGWKPDRVLALPVPGMFARFAAVAFGSLWVYSSLPSGMIVRVPLDELE